MALKQLMIQKKIDQRNKVLATLREKDADFIKRSDDLQKALEEAQNDDEISVVEESITTFEAEDAEHKEESGKLEKEIADLEEELAELSTNEPESKPKPVEGGQRNMNTQLQQRVSGQEYFTREVEDFYKELRTRLQSRANGNVLPPGSDGAELAIPDIVTTRIRERIGDFTTLYPLVDKVVAKGRVKLILDVDTTEATWLEQRGTPLPESDDSELTAVEFDGFLIGRIVYIDNSLLQDSQPIINLDSYLTSRIARSIAKGLDKAIAIGEGKDAKQPKGIIPSIPALNKVTAKPEYTEIIPHIGLIDTGEDSTGEIVLAMHRQTYYNRIANLTLHISAEGKEVVQLPNLAQPNFLGLKVVFNNYIPADTLILGVFDKYTLVERETTRIESSIHYKFRDNQTAIRGLGRYDGQPVVPEAFVEITLDVE